MKAPGLKGSRLGREKSKERSRLPLRAGNKARTRPQALGSQNRALKGILSAHFSFLNKVKDEVKWRETKGRVEILSAFLRV